MNSGRIREKRQPLSRDRNPDSGIPGDLKSDSDSSPDRDSRYGNYPPEATCGYSCKHKKTLEEDPSAFAFDEVYDDMKHRDIVPKLQDRQDLKLTCVAGSGKGVSDTPVTLHIANAELAPTHPICLEAKEIERDGVRDGRVVSEKTWEGARFRRTPAGGREQRRQYGGTKDWYVSGQDLRWLHLLTTTTDLLRSREVKSVV
ncbi:hypothetical protein Bca4012_007241 [Brassica carinata]